MPHHARMALQGAALSLLLLAVAQPAEARSSHHHPARHHVARAHHHAAPAVAPDPDAGPVWSDASGRWRQTGIASWYGGKRWQGRRTTSGEHFDDQALTAAHATLPLGSQVRVIVADTGRSVVVTINDRPGTRRRIIDLSRAAAARLGILERGVATVTLLPAR